MEIEEVRCEIAGKQVIFACEAGIDDAYVNGLRRGIYSTEISEHADRLTHLRRRPIKMADFGANIGTVSFPAAIVSLAEVLAVEALASNLALLIEGTRANKLFGQVLPVLMAAYSTTGIVPMVGRSAWGGIKDGGVPVPCARLIDILEMYNFLDVDFIKIDIEGAELAALEGSDEFLRADQAPDIIFESNTHTCGRFNYEPQMLFEQFARNGYSLYVLDEKDVLIRIGSRSPQWKVVVDVLATKLSEEILVHALGYRIKDVSDELILDRLSIVPFSPVGAHFCKSQEKFMPLSILAHRKWIELKQKTKTGVLQSS